MFHGRGFLHSLLNHTIEWVRSQIDEGYVVCTPTSSHKDMRAGYTKKFNETLFGAHKYIYPRNIVTFRNFQSGSIGQTAVLQINPFAHVGVDFLLFSVFHDAIPVRGCPEVTLFLHPVRIDD